MANRKGGEVEPGHGAQAADVEGVGDPDGEDAEQQEKGLALQQPRGAGGRAQQPEGAHGQQQVVKTDQQPKARAVGDDQGGDRGGGGEMGRAPEQPMQLVGPRQEQGQGGDDAQQKHATSGPADPLVGAGKLDGEEEPGGDQGGDADILDFGGEQLAGERGEVEFQRVRARPDTGCHQHHEQSGCAEGVAPAHDDNDKTE